MDHDPALEGERGCDLLMSCIREMRSSEGMNVKDWDEYCSHVGWSSRRMCTVTIPTRELIGLFLFLFSLRLFC